MHLIFCHMVAPTSRSKEVMWHCDAQVLGAQSGFPKNLPEGKQMFAFTRFLHGSHVATRCAITLKFTRLLHGSGVVMCYILRDVHSL